MALTTTLSTSNPQLIITRFTTNTDQLHSHLTTTGQLRHPSTLHPLSNSPHPSHRRLAIRLLSHHPHPSHLHLWNSLISSSPSLQEALLSFSQIPFPPDEYSFSLALRACARARALEQGQQLHALIAKRGLWLNVFLVNCVVGLYCKCGLLEVARKVFDGMPERDVVSWNSMIGGYVKEGKMGLARELFDRMREEERSVVSWNLMVSGYARLGSEDGVLEARELFDRMPCRDLTSWNSMIDGYAKCGLMEDALGLFETMPERDIVSWGSVVFGYAEIRRVDVAERVFDEMPEKDVIAWNIMMSGYVKNGRFLDALRLFHKIQATRNVTPDVTTLSTVLSAISKLGYLYEGLAVHAYISEVKLHLNGKLGVSLIDMYAKCGQLQMALEVFEISGVRSTDHWNAIINAMAIHGFGHTAVRLFLHMVSLEIPPDDITFVGVLSACSHSGLTSLGLFYFEKMISCFKIKPKEKHYGCLVDMMARAGRIEDAKVLMDHVAISPNGVMLRALLSGCRKQCEIEINEVVDKSLVESGDCGAGSYVLLSNIYAGEGLWRDARKIRGLMKEKNLNKVVGRSWIEIDGVVHEFVVGDYIYS